MILYGASLSPYVRKVLAFAAEKGLELELRPGGMGQGGAAFEAASPFRRMPAFRDGDFAISDSSAIVTYLDAKYPDPGLIPDTPEARARTIWFDEFGDTILMGCGREIFFNRVVAPRFLKMAGDLAAAERAEREGLPPILDYLERTIPDSLFLVDDRLTLADLAVASPFANLRHLDIVPDAATHPRTAAFVDSVLARPSFAEWLPREAAYLAKFT